MKEPFTLYGVWILKIKRDGVVSFEGAFPSNAAAKAILDKLKGDAATIHFQDLRTQHVDSQMTYINGWAQV